LILADHALECPRGTGKVTVQWRVLRKALTNEAL
jgi:hypothetical protein